MEKTSSQKSPAFLWGCFCSVKHRPKKTKINSQKFGELCPVLRLQAEIGFREKGNWRWLNDDDGQYAWWYAAAICWYVGGVVCQVGNNCVIPGQYPSTHIPPTCTHHQFWKVFWVCFCISWKLSEISRKPDGNIVSFGPRGRHKF